MFRQPHEEPTEQERRDEYWRRQDELQKTGCTPYNCDELDEFPNMNNRR